ncbi:MAG: hypothetical protein JWL70_1736 [Acidimicrobiia bacterium]|nr:hypothetical protein [Acidimicrobiia bacterium]
MAPRARTSRAAPAVEPPVVPDLLGPLGLEVGEAVRFAPSASGQNRLQPGTVRGSNKDGSLTISDTKGAARAIPPERVWRSAKTKRGRLTWVPLLDGGEAQLALFRPKDV